MCARIVVKPWKSSRLRFSKRIARKTETTGAGPLAAADLNWRQMDAHFTKCPRRPAAPITWTGEAEG
jgi:hypothetical protein